MVKIGVSNNIIKNVKSVIVTKGVEATIRNVGRLGRDGMRETDKEIVKIMMNG